MAEEKPAEVAEAVAAAEEEPKPAKRTRKSGLEGGLDPAPVLSGPRQRKKVEHFQVEVKEKAEFVIKPGKGSKLGDIPNVHFQMSKLKADDDLVTSLHSLLFKRPGTAHRRKRNLFEFSGLTFDEGDQAKEADKLVERLNKWTISLLNSALDVFELPRGAGDDGKKEAKVERLMKFLEEPKKMSEKDLAAAAAKKKDAAAKKREKAQKAQTPKSTPKGKKASEESSKKKRSKKSEDEGEDAEESDDEEVEEEEEEEEAEEPPKKKARKSEASPAKKTAEKKPASTKKSTGKKRKADEEKEDGQPAADELPSDEEIREATLAALAVSDVNSTTVRDLLKVLNQKFGKDLSSKKALVKQIAVSYATAGSAAAGAEGDKEDEEKAAGDSLEPVAKEEQATEETGGEKGSSEEGEAAKAEALPKDDAEANAGEEAPKEEAAKSDADAKEEDKDAKEQEAPEDGSAAVEEEPKEGQDAEMTDGPKADSD